ncbi:MAG: hypothetical protein M3N08_03515 [Pseudomonadota bacterium]|nr:hypothetical protein [Pseudomonadota bacterium]
MSARQNRRLYQVASHLINTRAAKEQGFYDRFVKSLFVRAAKELTMWPAQLRKAGEVDDLFASVIGIINPSDGHPQEEHTPDFGWFRPLAHNNPTWVLYWPELEV